MTFRKKLIALYSALLALIILLFGLLVFGVIRSTWIEALDDTLHETAKQVISNSRSFPVREFGSPSTTRIVLPQLDIFRASGVLVQAWSLQPDGTSTFAAASDNLGDYKDPLDPATLGVREPTVTNAFVNGTELRVLTRPIIVVGQDRLFGNIQVAASLQTINEATRKLSLAMVLGGGGAMLGSLLIGMWLSHQAVRPINAITCAADSIATARDLNTRLPWDGPEDDELGRMVSVFNRMMDRLEHLFGAQRRLVADVSHELRTPLTAIRGNLDIIRRYGVDQESLDAIASETERMSRLVNDLLLLARADYGSMQIDLSQVDLDTVIADVYKEAQILVKDRDLQVKLATVEPVRLMGNSDRLKQLLLNLVDNAIKFTPDGGQITLSLRQAENMAVIQVRDTGMGIAPEDLKRVFDRFYQADPARARSDEDGGAGLGLSIAKWIAEAHGGSIEVESVPGAGTTFTVKLRAFEPDADEPPSSATYNTYLSLQRFVRRRRPYVETSPGH